MDTKQEYAQGTYTVQSYPWGYYRGGAALCPDGKVRKLKRISTTADTFFSVPASVTVKGKTVSGYIGFTSVNGYDTTTADDPAIVRFYPYQYGKNGHLLSQESQVAS